MVAFGKWELETEMDFDAGSGVFASFFIFLILFLYNSYILLSFEFKLKIWAIPPPLFLPHTAFCELSV